MTTAALFTEQQKLKIEFAIVEQNTIKIKPCIIDARTRSQNELQSSLKVDPSTSRGVRLGSLDIWSEY